MRDNKEILEEIKEQVIKDNYYSVDNICLLAMEQSNKEYKEDIVNALENLFNNYRAIDGCYVIEKSMLDNFIDNLDTFGRIF